MCAYLLGMTSSRGTASLLLDLQLNLRRLPPTPRAPPEYVHMIYWGVRKQRLAAHARVRYLGSMAWLSCCWICCCIWGI